MTLTIIVLYGTISDKDLVLGTQETSIESRVVYSLWSCRMRDKTITIQLPAIATDKLRVGIRKRITMDKALLTTTLFGKFN